MLESVPMRIRPALVPICALLFLPALQAQEEAVPPLPASVQLQTELQLERKILALDLVGYREARTKEQAARDRVSAAMQRLDQALAGDALSLGTLESLFGELTTARATASAAAEQMDWQVRFLQERMRRISFLEGEVSGRGMRETTLAGRWQVQLSPTSQTGTLVLQLSGTAISGTYRIQGGTSGAVRGDLSGSRVRIELLNTAGTLESTWTGGYDPATQTMAGTWLATEMAAGQPAQGAWRATRPAAATEREP